MIFVYHPRGDTPPPINYHNILKIHDIYTIKFFSGNGMAHLCKGKEGVKQSLLRRNPAVFLPEARNFTPWVISRTFFPAYLETNLSPAFP